VPDTSIQAGGFCDLSKTKAETFFSPPLGVKVAEAAITSLMGFVKVAPSGPSSITRLASAASEMPPPLKAPGDFMSSGSWSNRY